MEMSLEPFSMEEDEKEAFNWEIENYGSSAPGEFFVSKDYISMSVLWSFTLRKGRRVTKSGEENSVVYTVSGYREGREPIRVKIRFIVTTAAGVRILLADEVFETYGSIIFYKGVLAKEPLPNEYLVNGVLKLRFNMAFSKIQKCDAISSESSRHKSNVKALQSDIRSYLSKQDSGHVVLRVEEKEFRVHKFILSARSPVFREKLEKVMNETLTDPIIIKDVSAAVFKRMVSYMNGNEVDKTSRDTCIGLYVAAEKYCMKDLKTRCARLLEKNLSTDIVCEVASMAHLDQDAQLLSSVKRYISSHAAEVFCSKGWVELLTKMPALASNLAAAV